MLKYLFTATYSDGSKLEQTQEDKSQKEPDKRSCYFDVEHDRLIQFSLEGDGHKYSVDLRDGHFEVDGRPFFMHQIENREADPMTVPNEVELKNFRLVYFRKNIRSFNAQVRDGQMGNPYEAGHQTSFLFGWQAQDAKGKNYQQVMKLN